MLDVEAFMGLAQIGVGLAGFSGIALALATGRHNFTASDRALVAFLLVNSGAVVFLGVLPVGIAMLGVPPEALWRGCSAAHALGIAFVIWPLFGPRALLNPRSLLWGMRFNVLTILLAQLLNSLGWLFTPSEGIYFLAVFFILPGTAIAFARLLFQFIGQRAG